MNWNNVSQRDRQVFYQGRLDKKLENQKIQLRDNLIRLTGTPEDILVISKKVDSNLTTKSTIVKAHIVTNVVFPPLKDVPVRKVKQDFGSGYVLTNIVSSYGEGSEQGSGQGNPQQDLTTLTIQLPLESDIEKDNKIIKVFIQENKVNTIMVFDVLEVLSSYSNNSPLTLSAKVALSTDPIDPEKKIYKMITTLADRRITAGY